MKAIQVPPEMTTFEIGPDGTGFMDIEVQHDVEEELQGIDLGMLTSVLYDTESCPDVQCEVEVGTSEAEDGDEEAEENEKVYHNLDNLSSSPSSDYVSESEQTQTSNMDLGAGSLDLTVRGPNRDLPSGLSPSAGDVSRPRPCFGIDKPFFPAPSIVLNITGSEDAGDTGTCLDLSKSGPNAALNGSSYMHYSGGTLGRNSGYVPNGFMPGFQLPRIKLQPGLGIDQSVKVEARTDLNHNDSVPMDSSNNIPPFAKSFAHYPDQEMSNGINGVNGLSYANGIPTEHGCDVETGAQSRVTVEECHAEDFSRIPLTVTSQDDDIDSGTESIDSKDSDSSIRLSVGGESTENNKEKSDRKRPGRKKGQVSKVYHLWEFIRDVLNDPRYSGNVIKWENEEEGIFRVVQSETAASMWGAKKNNRTKMTYEKMSRSIRYSRKEGYFDDLPKDKGYPKKLCFKFGKKAMGWNNKNPSDRL
ncbi:uncharacterized protein LOC128230537 isoform X2 [Mya arenaria]|uniref:uncharacterized protein LOC128230537 isoform X2 n=1 Tax=Mya arenaria TaxID=6604 RepID=UPI0022E522E9|nr:uncharacterized protein LOC128230537 isoform X2 [Mya arenaria]